MIEHKGEQQYLLNYYNITNKEKSLTSWIVHFDSKIILSSQTTSTWIQTYINWELILQDKGQIEVCHMLDLLSLKVPWPPNILEE